MRIIHRTGGVKRKGNAMSGSKDEEWMSVRKASYETGVPAQVIYRLVREGRVKVMRHGAKKGMQVEVYSVMSPLPEKKTKKEKKEKTVAKEPVRDGLDDATAEILRIASKVKWANPRSNSHPALAKAILDWKAAGAPDLPAEVCPHCNRPMDDE